MKHDKDSDKTYEETEELDYKKVSYINDKAVTSEVPKWYIQSRNIVYYILGVIEVLLLFRLLFKLLGASVNNALVAFLYAVTRWLISPFTGIFRTIILNGAVEHFIFEPDTIIAIIVYAIAARGIVSLIRLKIPDAA